MKKYYLIYMMSALLTASFTSCEDLLTEKPQSAYGAEDYFDSDSKAEMAIYGIYSSLSDLNHYGSREMAVPASDDTYFTARTTSDGAVHDMGHYALSSTNKWISDLWRLKYQTLDRANFAIAGIMNMAGYEENTKLQALVAEARFLRAFIAFDLVKGWGDVPFKTTYSSGYESAFQGRVSRETIYDEIIKDLDFAKTNLAWAQAGSNPERATQGAARALLMRVYLQRAGYSLQMVGKLTRPDDEKRKAYFRAVINEWEAFKESSHGFYTDGYEGLFKGFSAGTLNAQESLFEIAFFHAQGNRSGGWWGTYNAPAVAEPTGIESTESSKYMGRANAFFRVVPEWDKFFAEGDMRHDIMVCTYKYNWDAKNKVHTKTKKLKSNSWYPGKWRREWMPLGFKDPNCTDVNYCVLRYADVVLMAAEAYCETGEDLPMAWTLLNSVRTRSGAPAITTNNYSELLKAPKVYDLPFIADADEQGRFRTALYWERAFELAFEGQRKFDLIRWGVLKDALQLFGSKSELNQKEGTIPYPAYRNFVSGKHELFPIPLNEMQSNPKLEGKNNPQY